MGVSRSVGSMRAMRRVPSRRDVLRGLAGAGLGLSLAQFPNPNLNLNPNPVAARKKGKRKKRKPKKAQPNEFGCLNVGQPCQGDSALCCSGICEGAEPKNGKPDKSVCIAHDTGTCQQAGPGICLSDAPANLSCNNNARCRCFSTTAGSNVCGALWPPPQFCADCQRDADCAALGFPAGTACTPFSEGNCGGPCPSGMACVPPCGTEPPEPIS